MLVLERFSLKGRVALVTGGAGLYGKQIVAALTEAGADTIMASRNTDALQCLVRDHRDLGHSIDSLCLDLSSESSILALRDEIVRRWGRLDILVNNAVARPMKQGYHDQVATFAESMQVNATGLFAITRALGDLMAERGSGSIINIGSIMGMVGPDPQYYRNTSVIPWYPDYFFHKGGMINYTRFVASYYGGRGIRCNCVSAGGLRTEDHSPTFVSQYSERTMLGRMAGETDLMGIVVFLASDASAYLTGTNIPVDGGFTAK